MDIYNKDLLKFYRGKLRSEANPHIFAICDEAYREMMDSNTNQTILVTGESGSGKTFNTGKIIQYFAERGSAADKSLEQQILQANPILEAFGNAKTPRNNNSSRFGKFISLKFDAGIITGASIEYYLMEKGRVVHHSEEERSFHVFYQLIDGAPKELAQDLLLEDFTNYKYLKGIQDISGVSNLNSFFETSEAMSVMGFDQEQQKSIWSVLSGILQIGNLEFETDQNDDSAKLISKNTLEKVCKLLAVEKNEFLSALLSPQVKAGEFTVTSTVTSEQATYSCNALTKSIYERLFKYLVQKINKAMHYTGSHRSYVGVLDIAGFEIFEQNSFEQFCVNFTNEKLQQFFNHRMFVLEQKNYINEGIEWSYIDFGLDLQPTIDLIEKPNGILPILDEECVFPKANDTTFISKLNKLHSENEKFSGVRLERNAFIVQHYAGNVRYTVDGWLDKNQDPLHNGLASIMSKSNSKLVCEIFGDINSSNALGRSNSGRRKGAKFTTVGQRHRSQLNELMAQIEKTVPHFVRCILPNDRKEKSFLDPKLVMPQLQCNGVLEGIRITRLGYPSRISFAEFRNRYYILAPPCTISSTQMDNRIACEALIKQFNLSSGQYKMGKSKVFFKAEILGELEDKRAQKIGSNIIKLQCVLRGFLKRKEIGNLKKLSKQARVIQRLVRRKQSLKRDKWWSLYKIAKPIIKAHSEKKIETKFREEIDILREKLDKSESACSQATKELQVAIASFEKEKNDLSKALDVSSRQLKAQEIEGKSLASKIQLLNEENDSLKRDRDELFRKRDELSNKLNELAEEKSALEEKVLTLEEAISSSTNALEVSFEDIEKFKLKNEESEEQILSLREQLSNYELQIERSHSSSQKATQKLKITQMEIIENEKLISFLKSNNEHLEKAIEENSKELDHLRMHKIDLENRLKEVEKVNLELEDSNITLKTKVEHLSKENDEFQALLHQMTEESNTLESELRSESSRIISLKKNVEEKNVEIEHLKTIHYSQQSHLEDRLSCIRDKLQSKIDEQHQEILGLHSTISDFKAKLQSSDKKFALVQQESDLSLKEVTDLKKQKSLLLESNDYLQSEIDNLKLSHKKETSRLWEENEKKIFDLESKYAKTQRDLEENFRRKESELSTEIRDLNGKIQSLKDSIESESHAKNLLNLELDQNNDELESKEIHIQNLEKQIYIMEPEAKQATELRQKNDELFLENDKLSFEVNRMTSEVKSLSKSLETLESTNGKLEAELAEQKSRNFDLEGEITHFRQENTGLKKSIKKLNEAVEDYKLKIDNMAAEHKKMEATCNDATDRFFTLSEDNDSLRDRVHDLEVKLQEINGSEGDHNRAELEKVTKALDFCERTIKNLNVEIDQQASYFEEVQRKNSKLLGQLEIANSTHQEEILRKNNEICNLRSLLQQERKESKKNKLNLCQEMEENINQFKNLENEMLKKDNEKSELLQKIESLESSNEHLDESLRKTHTELYNSEKRRTEISHEFDRFKSRFWTMEAKYQALKTEISSGSSEKRELVQKIEQLNRRIFSLKEESDYLKLDNEKVKKAHRRLLEENSISNEQDLDSKRTRKLQQEYEELKKMVESFDRSKKSEIIGLKSSMISKIDKLEAELSNLKFELRKTVKEKVRLKNELDIANECLNRDVSVIDEINTERKVLRRQLSDTQIKLGAKEELLAKSQQEKK